MLEWLIIGGGIHGTHLSFVLTHQHRIPADRVRVLDPYHEPLARWHAVTTNTGMDYLRSPLVHHLHYDQRALGVFARIYHTADYTRFIPTYSRPSLELFNRYSTYLIEKYRLDRLRIEGRAQGLTRIENGWRIETADGGIEAKNILLAFGKTEQPYYPAWAQSSRINHIFDLDFTPQQLPDWKSLVIVGGGITAVQTALSLSAHASVTILTRHPVRIHDFDSDPCWLNALCLRDFHVVSDYTQRRQIITTARHRGSMPQDVAQALQIAIEQGKVRYQIGEVSQAIDTPHQIELNLTTQDKLLADQVILATGWQGGRPGGAWLTTAIETHGLSIASDGFPIVDKTLCWSPGLYVSGALAELEIGPASRNIIGARLAVQRLTPIL